MDRGRDQKQTKEGPPSTDSTTQNDSGSSQQSGLMRAWLYGAMVMQFTSSVIGGALSGVMLDHWWQTEPVFLLIMLPTGSVAGFVLLLRGLKQLEQGNK